LSEIFTKEFFPGCSLGLPIEGTKKTVRSFNRELTKNFHARLCQPQNIVVACAGNVEHEPIVELAQKYFDSSNSANSLDTSFINETVPVAAPIFIKKKKNLEQAHLIIAAPWINSSDERRYAASLLTGILGDGNSSRLWQTVREEHGLAYSVGASGTSFRDCGVFSIYAGTSPEKLPETIDLSVAEIRKIKREGVSETELRLAKDQITASILLGLEDSAARAANLAQQEITYGKQISVEETLLRFESVTIDEIRELTTEFFETEKIAFGALGNLNGFKINRSRLEI
jgi:predicted Zn-dependent peptidase